MTGAPVTCEPLLRLPAALRRPVLILEFLRAQCF